MSYNVSISAALKLAPLLWREKLISAVALIRVKTVVMRQSGTWALKLLVVASRDTIPDVVENGQERIKTTHGTLFSSWI